MIGSIVQFGTAIGGANPTVALPNAPTPGNLLIALGSHYNNNPGTQNGYNGLTINNGGDDGTMAAYKVATAADGANQTPFSTGDGGQSLAVIEVSGSTGNPVSINNFVDNHSTSLTLQDANGQAAPGLLLGVFCQNQSTDDFTLSQGVYDIADGTGNTNNNGPRRIKAVAINASGQPQNLVATLGAGHSSTGTLVYIPGSTLAAPVSKAVEASQIAFVIPSPDVPFTSAGANVNLFAIVSVDSEYITKPALHPQTIRALWGFPLLIQKG